MYRHTTLFVILITFLTFNVLFFSVSSAEEDYSADVHITEFIPNPVGDDSELEFIELYNGSDFDVDLSEWVVDTGGSARFIIESGTILGAQSFLTFYSADKNIALTNSGDHIQFIRPNAVVQDDIVYTSSIEGHSYIRLDTGIYGGSATPTPNSANTPLPTPTVTPTPTPTIAPTPTLSESPTPILYSTEVHVSEFLPSPEGDDGELEFIELHNSSTSEIDISGWIIDTGPTSRFTIAPGTVIAPGLYVVFFSSLYDISLSNSSDHIQLVRPDGVVQDDISYTETKEGHSYNRSDAGAYDQSFTPTANAANTITASPTPTPKPTATASPKSEESTITYEYSSLLVINELLPNPEGSDEEYEYIEIKNLDTKTVRLAGWTLDDAVKGSAFHFTDESILAGKILVFERKKTKIALNNDTDTVSLINPKGKVISTVVYSKVVPEGQSWNRAVDGAYAWSETLTPGRENTIVVLKKASPTPKPKKPKVVAVKKKASASPQASALRAPSVLAARDEKLPWTETVSRTVVYPPNETLPATGKQRLFVLFGATAAFAQLASGISRKERIWRM
ncbi:MAG: hypothetical protein A3C02_00505 [Candidatus Andersenbacteria bacterium RIFCSPHIGHO2_02_FULL_45_11]|nr:MAG: hypothetical protein A2805_03975 [Candidatus Andersenbacteria bacterium RIFCSPHIGHO2_01_FULL_46_36]OGY33697.1 MAG: hypothetical protein A3C02_00505 [Candidatus Andersenbacteria bacterium RIFCSPHIGHO2_02_FULL_45_11]